MQRLILTLIAILFCTGASADVYIDHRGHPVDSLEEVVSRWTPQMIENASDSALKELVLNWQELMLGTLQLNDKRSQYYARKILSVASPRKWRSMEYDANRILGQCFWADGQYDSAAVYFKLGLDAVSKMETGDTGTMDQEGYTEKDIDNGRSSLYGAIGNLYSMQDSVETAMEYYEKAGEIFKKHGWLNSCAVLYYNMGETWGYAGEFDKSEDCYGESLQYALEANDSLWIAGALKGFGALYLEQGKTAKALKYLRKADGYYSIHQDEELFARLETVDYIGQVLALQKKSLAVWLSVTVLAALLALALLVIVGRLRQARKEQKETSEVFEETLAEMTPAAQPGTMVKDHGTSGPELSPDSARQTPAIKLNDREVAILRFLSEGRTTPQIADKLCLSPETIKWYRKKLLFKFDATSSAELVRKAIDFHLLDH